MKIRLFDKYNKKNDFVIRSYNIFLLNNDAFCLKQ